MRFIKKAWAAFTLLSFELIVITLCFTVAFTGFLYIADYVFLEHKTDFDDAAFLHLENIVSDVNTNIMRFFSFLGNYKFLTAANMLLIGYFLFIRKHRWYSIKVPAIAISSTIIMLLLKYIFQRQRPLMPLLHPAAGLSFPSGHALCSVTFFGLLIYFVWKHTTNKFRRFSLTTVLSLTIFMIGLSRVYLRVHHASDVIAGFCLGYVWLVISLKIMRRIENYSIKKLEEKNMAVV